MSRQITCMIFLLVLIISVMIFVPQSDIISFLEWVGRNFREFLSKHGILNILESIGRNFRNYIK